MLASRNLKTNENATVNKRVIIRISLLIYFTGKITLLYSFDTFLLWFSCFDWFNSLLGCGLYFNDQKLLQVPVDLTKPKPTNDQTFRFKASGCTLSGKDFHDYSGFQSSWKNINDNFFVLEKRGSNFDVNVSLWMFSNFCWILAIIIRNF